MNAEEHLWPPSDAQLCVTDPKDSGGKLVAFTNAQNTQLWPFSSHLFLFFALCNIVQQGISGREDVWGQVSAQSSLSLHLLQLKKV